MRIYGIFDKQRNRIIYVGKTKNINDYKPHGRTIKNIIKSKPDRFEYQILETINVESLLNEREVFYIEKHNTFKDNSCYNFTIGGDGGWTGVKLTLEQKEIIKEKRRKTILNQPDILIRAAKKGRETFLKRPEEERQRITAERLEKSYKAKKIKFNSLTLEEKLQRSKDNAERVKNIHMNRSDEEKARIKEKIRAAFNPIYFTLINIKTSEIKTLNAAQWQIQYKVMTCDLMKPILSKFTSYRVSKGWKLYQPN